MPDNIAKLIGVIVAQLGTPDEPTPQSVRAYLSRFLSDRRVIDYHPLLWQPILHGMILRTRPARSARLYQRIWLPEGSPLKVYSCQQVTGLQVRLGDGFRVVLGMTYSQPDIRAAMRSLEAEDIDRIIVLPMFPQYSSTTTAPIYESTFDAATGRRSLFAHEQKRNIPALRFVEPHSDHSWYIDAMKAHLLDVIAHLPAEPDHFVITFHGIPNRYVTSGDPYRQQCEQTADLLAQAMGWNRDDWSIGFQSQFGPEAWLQPYTDQVIAGLHQRGIERPLVFSPGFVTDCLETLVELGNEGREQFAAGGGVAEQFHLAPCLNANPLWLDALAEFVRRSAGGWIAEAPQSTIEAV